MKQMVQGLLASFNRIQPSRPGLFRILFREGAIETDRKMEVETDCEREKRGRKRGDLQTRTQTIT